MIVVASKKATEPDVRVSGVFGRCKLLLWPPVTGIMAAAVFGLPPCRVDLAVLLIAIPTGTGPFCSPFNHGFACHAKWLAGPDQRLGGAGTLASIWRGAVSYHVRQSKVAL